MTLRSSLVLALSLVACGKGDDKGGGGGGTPKADEPVKLTWKKVPSMGIEVEVNAKADVQDNTASSGFPSSTIYSMDGTPTTFIFGHKGDPAESVAISKDFDATKARAQKEMNGFKSFTKEDSKPDGTFELRLVGTDMLEKDKPLHGIVIRSKIGDLTIDCQTNASTEAEIEKTARLCRSIRAAQ